MTAASGSFSPTGLPVELKGLETCVHYIHLLCKSVLKTTLGAKNFPWHSTNKDTIC